MRRRTEKKDCFERKLISELNSLHPPEREQMTALISFPCVFVSKKLHVFFWLCYITNGKRLSEHYWVIVALGKIAKHSRSFSHTGLSPHAIISLLSNPPRATIYAIENVSMFAWRLVRIKKKNVFYCLFMTYLSTEKKTVCHGTIKR